MTIFNYSDVGSSSYDVICKKIHMSLLHDHSNHMVIPRLFQKKFKK
jgi:hypothetical protein